MASTADSSEVATEPMTSARSVALRSVRDRVKVEKSCSRTLIVTVAGEQLCGRSRPPPDVRRVARSCRARAETRSASKVSRPRSTSSPIRLDRTVVAGVGQPEQGLRGFCRSPGPTQSDAQPWRSATVWDADAAQLLLGDGADAGMTATFIGRKSSSSRRLRRWSCRPAWPVRWPPWQQTSTCRPPRRSGHSWSPEPHP